MYEDNPKKPIEEAEEVEIHDYGYIQEWWYDSKQRYHKNCIENFTKNYRDAFRFPDGRIRGVEIKPTKAWIVEVDNLCSLVDKYGDIIIKKPDCEEGYYELEIYDTYRE